MNTQPVTIQCGEPKIGWAPYVWKFTGSGAAARAEATMPGAYFKCSFQGSKTLGLLIDGTANTGCPASAMPVFEYSLDQGPFKVAQLTRTGECYSLPLSDGLDENTPHCLEFHFRAAALGVNRFQTSTLHLRIAGIQLDAGGSILPTTLKPKRAIGFGDSITEGVCVDGLCPYYSNLLMNNARGTWFPIVSAALNCEYGQLGTGGQGMVRLMSISPLPKSWDHYDSTTSRLSNGLLLPEPDYVFCCMGTNDFEGDGAAFKLLDIKSAYTEWLVAVRKACPHARIFCVTPPLGWHASEISEAVALRNAEGDRKVALIDTACLKSGFDPKKATQLAPDGVHPSLYGQALLGALVAAEAQRFM